jgi:hypothetical protein
MRRGDTSGSQGEVEERGWHGPSGPECAVRLGWSCMAGLLGQLGHGGLGPKPSERKERLSNFIWILFE